MAVTLSRCMRPPCALVLTLLALLLWSASPARAADPVAQTLDRLEASGAATPEDVTAWRSDWREARIAARRLTGTSAANMAAVVANTRRLAAQRRLGARVRPAMRVLEVNIEWFWRQRLAAPANGTRRAFAGSDVVFQLYSGNGWQLQPLANLGTLSSLSRRKRISDRTRAWATDLLALAVRRDGAIAFEYLFPWAGGGPGWASAMPQAIALETYARLGMRDEARRMFRLFVMAPPKGVRLDTAPGRAHFLMYPQAPRLLIGNGFAQAVLSLDAYAALEPDDADVQEAYQAGLAEARATMASYDTGAWSRYYHLPGSLQGSESDAHYHELFRSFLVRLCDRFEEEPFCGMAENFARYETEPVGLTAARLAATRRTLTASVTVSKRSSLTATLWRDDTAVRSVTVGASARGTLRIPFTRPEQAGSYRVVFAARALTGQRSSTEVTRELGRRPAR